MRCLTNAPAERNPNRHRSPGRLPYGCFFTESGEIIAFDRRYRPIYSCGRDGAVARDDPSRRVPAIRGQIWFYADRTSPRIDAESLQRILVIRERWEAAAAAGLPVDPAQLIPREWIVSRKCKGMAA